MAVHCKHAARAIGHRSPNAIEDVSELFGQVVSRHSFRGAANLLLGGGMTKNPGAQFEISLDGIPRTYRDRHDLALEAAGLLKRHNHRCEVAVKDLRTNERTVIAAATNPFAVSKSH